MKTHFLLWALAAAVAVPAYAAKTDSAAEYATLLAALKGGNTSIDYGRLRISYMDSPEYKHAKDTTAAEKVMWDALNAKDFQKALKNAEEMLDSEYVNIDAHFVAYVANKELGATDKAQFHLTVFQGLLNSIRDSVDGLSPETAWVVIKVHEEYVFLNVLGYKPTGQSTGVKNGRHYDEMKVKKLDDGSEATFYFNVDIPFKQY